ncbi:diguanylate cyclase (GGDEF) domain-containing protein [Thioflavicoccus mobilis 8321]|uniref:diguanylate cyclase n=1 Tax=Thioflavicoccus mobilis 8321 TaxID=765912 RepID=L0GU28_9GAMM|nr:GGDEF domain-containing protein [Thioflavicoccus mobilis]AGA89466.1 diguanylate cyclase (GGDEF) domain-containing protein [Thioflavicoccus mobilis 8321]
MKNFTSYNRQALIDAVVLLVAVALTGALLHGLDATEALYEYSRSHEGYELDEIILTVAVSSIYLSVYTLRRLRNLQALLVAASTDPLIGITNRRRGSDLIAALVQGQGPNNELASIIMFDVDDFKRINDDYGHDTGDEVLTELIEVVQEETRRMDIVIRWGGEEFIILCPRTHADEACQLAERIRIAVERHRFRDVGQVTASFGVTALAPNENLRSQVVRADRGLYESKRLGKNRVTMA